MDNLILFIRPVLLMPIGVCRIMKKLLTPEELRAKAKASASYLEGEVFDLQETSPLVYCLIAKYGKTNKAFFRFFAVVDGHIEDITKHVHYVTGYPMLDCKQYWAIYTHSTNAEDIVEYLSEKIYSPDRLIPYVNDREKIIRMEKL
jgi:hypothetical protein